MPQRRPLGEISGYTPVGHELTVNKRAQIASAVKYSIKIADAARAFDFTHLTVKTTI
jgi:hypothetical protein